MARRRDWWIAVGVVAVVIIIMMIFWGNPKQTAEFEVVGGDSGERIGVVEIIGPIYDSKPTLKLLEQFEERGDLKGILVRIDSPGGGVAASQEIYEELRRMRNNGMPIVVSMGSVAASGGYYIACAGDSIVANPGTTTGSIGVIAEFPVVADLISRWGIQFETVKSGRFKDTGSPFRKVTSEDRKWVQNWIDDAFDQFLTVVSTERNLPMDTVRVYATGRVYTGRQALKMGLVDKLGNFHSAVDLLASMAGIEGKPKLVYRKKHRLSLWTLLTEDVRDWIPMLAWTYLNPYRYQ
jgi:protease-4